MGKENPSEAVAAGLEISGMIIKPIRIVDMGEIEAWAQGRVIEDAARAISVVGLVNDDARLLLQEAFLERRKIIFLSGDAQSLILESVEGIARLIWLSARQENPELTLEDVADKLGTLDQMEDLANHILEQSGFLPEEKKTEGTNGKAGKSKKRE